MEDRIHLRTSLLDYSNDSFISINHDTSFNSNLDRLYITFRKDLLEMGYPLRLINKVYNYFQPNSIEDMITLMSKENNIWQHNYISDDQLCLICGEDSDHLNYTSPAQLMTQIENRQSLKKIIEIRLSNLRSNSINSVISSKFPSPELVFKQNEISENKNYDLKFISFNTNNNKICPVCMDIPTEMFSLDCNHKFCKGCWGDYIHSDIFSGKDLTKINCMQSNCTIVMTNEIIYEFLNLCFPADKTPEIIQSYEYFKLKAEILKSKDKKFCPVVNCKSYGMKKRDANNVISKFVTCEFGHEFCFDCLVKKIEHKKISCEELIDENFEEWRRGKGVKQCPNCALWTEKNEGCNHMTCVACGFQWCWLCLAAYYATHYTDATSTCYNRQFWNEGAEHVNNNINFNHVNNDVDENPNYLNRFRIGEKWEYSLNDISLILISIVAGSSLLTIKKTKRKLEEEYFMDSKFISYMIYATVGFAAFMFNPIFIVTSLICLTFFLTISPIFILFWIVSVLKHRCNRRNQRNNRNYLHQV